MTTATHFTAFCNTCHQTKLFTSERQRDLWEKFHPHDDEEEE